MKKIALFLLISALTITTLASCGSNDEGTTTTAAKTDAPAVTTTAATEGNEPEATTAAPTEGKEPEATTAPTEGEEGNQPEPAEKAFITLWEDNNGEDVFYEITTNEDGTVTVDYTKEDYASAEARYGYAGASWVNMKADISDIFTEQLTLVMKVKGEAGKSILIKPFDDQFYEKTLTFDGSEQTIEFDLSWPDEDADLVIILFGDGGATDASGTFTILEAYLI